MRKRCLGHPDAIIVAAMPSSFVLRDGLARRRDSERVSEEVERAQHAAPQRDAGAANNLLLILIPIN